MTPRLLLSLFALLALSLPAAAADPDLTGRWEGRLRFSGTSLRLVIHVERKGEGYRGSVDSPDQGAKGIPASKVTVTGRTLRVEVARISGLYEGELDPEGKTIKGTWTQGGSKLELVLGKDELPPSAPPARPQHPKGPFPYSSVEVSIPHVEGALAKGDAKGAVTLAGTLTLPPGEGPFPGIVLITGSGPQDRDETLMGHKPFLVLADALTRRGFAVLRYDDRGVGKSTGRFALATSEDLSHDAQAVLRFLAKRPEVDAKRVGLCGHSEGGIIAPMVAARVPEEVAFAVLLAGTGVTGAEVVTLQGELLARAAGASEEQIARDCKLSKALCEIVTRDAPKSERQAAAAKELERFYKEDLNEAERKAAGTVQAFKLSQLKIFFSVWFEFFLRFDPATALRKTRCPVLALNGSKDLQVVAQQNLPAIARSLEAGGNNDYTIVKLPGLNHLFQTCKTGAVAEYAQLSETFSPKALKLVGDWLQRFRKP